MNLQRSPNHQLSSNLEKGTILPVLLIELEEIEEQLETLQQTRTTLLTKIAQAEQQVACAEQLLKASCVACT
ncbi:MAG: hypothetical protein SFY66_11955 [Oculatellaceae cyanobacterium bins.114]|nr:hypothetical protein [Oculatellaceae cyanobacterium bins.114]